MMQIHARLPILARKLQGTLAAANLQTEPCETHPVSIGCHQAGVGDLHMLEVCPGDVPALYSWHLDRTHTSADAGLMVLMQACRNQN